jgi:hypothetical protein
VQRRRIPDWAQPVLDLNPQPYVAPVTRDVPGLIDSVAALLLAAIGVSQVERPIESEGEDEQ